MINKYLLEKIRRLEIHSEPFNHAIIDDFFDLTFADSLELDFIEKRAKINWEKNK